VDLCCDESNADLLLASSCLLQYTVNSVFTDFPCNVQTTTDFETVFFLSPLVWLVFPTLKHDNTVLSVEVFLFM